MIDAAYQATQQSMKSGSNKTLETGTTVQSELLQAELAKILQH